VTGKTVISVCVCMYVYVYLNGHVLGVKVNFFGCAQIMTTGGEQGTVPFILKFYVLVTMHPHKIL